MAEELLSRGLARGHSMVRRRGSEAAAMPWMQRLGIHLRNSIQNKDDDLDGSSTHHGGGKSQYRISTVVPSSPSNWCLKLLTCNGWLTTTRRSSKFATGSNPNHRLARSLHWMFRVNFILLFIAMCLTFFALVILFAGFITMGGRMDPRCVRIGNSDFASSGAPFADAFALSWTTFATVGYGSTYPALGHENENSTNCFFVNFICSLESLLGVLYAGFCGAILFGKVLRIQSHAQVIFSDPLLIRYGKGVTGVSRENESNDEEKNHVPCPVLEFRIVNRLFDEVGGEIMDASLNVVANINADDADPSTIEALEGGSGQSIGTSTRTANSEESSTKRAKSSVRSLPKLFGPMAFSRRDHIAVDEDPSNRFIHHKHVFSKLMIDAPEHPFFKRCWVATHVLDQHSPILKTKVRRRIRKNGGYWPANLNNYKSIRESLQFNQILVSMNGVSNISASDVYAQKI